MSEIKTIKIKNPLTGETVYPETSWEQIQNKPEIKNEISWDEVTGKPDLQAQIAANIDIANEGYQEMGSLTSISFDGTTVYTIGTGDVTWDSLESGISTAYVSTETADISSMFADDADINNASIDNLTVTDSLNVVTNIINEIGGTESITLDVASCIKDLKNDLYNEDDGVFAKLYELQEYVKYLANIHNVTLGLDVTTNEGNFYCLDENEDKQFIVCETTEVIDDAI